MASCYGHQGQVDAAHVGAANPAPDLDGALSALEQSLIPSGISKQTHDSIAAEVAQDKSGRRKPDPGKPPDVSTIAGLLLGSPEFQRR